MATRFDAAGGQIDGDRDYQEDAFLITRLGQGEREGTLIVVADGMGGHAAGNVASNMAVQTFNKYITAHYPCRDAAVVLRESTLQANHSIAETVRETAALKGMGCTLVACLLEDARLYWASVGDSHLFLLRDGQLAKCNADHSYGAFIDRMAAAGHEVRPDVGLNRNMLMSALTGDDIPELDCPSAGLGLQQGDRLIVCSDGLDSLGTARVLEVALAHPRARACVDALLEAVSAAAVPRQDNTTVVVVDVLNGAQSERPNRASFGATIGAPGAGAGATARPPATVATGLPGRQANTPPATAMPSADETAPAQTTDRPGVRRFKASEAARTAPSALPGLLTAFALLLVIGASGAWWYAAHQVPELPPIDLSALPDRAPSRATVPASDGATDAATAVSAEAATEQLEEPVALPSPFRDALAGGGQGPLMVVVPGGSFQMGSGLLGEEQDEGPVREVRIRSFALSAHEVTRGEWNRFARTRGLRLQQGDADQPASGMHWEAAVAYVAWLAEGSAQPYRLPTEAEWEYAARGGSTGLYWWGNTPGTGQAWCVGCAPGLEPLEPTRVGQFNANGFGLFDTAGNVAEWVQDCYRPTYEGAPTDGSAVEDAACTLRVHRGGSWSSPSRQLRTTRRAKATATTGSPTIGLRVARDLTPP